MRSQALGALSLRRGMWLTPAAWEVEQSGLGMPVIPGNPSRPGVWTPREEQATNRNTKASTGVGWSLLDGLQCRSADHASSTSDLFPALGFREAF